MTRLILESSFSPRGDQPEAIRKLVAGIEQSKKAQVLLGITGSGKTFTMAHVIAQCGRPALILAHNKTLAAQLYEEFRNFFPSHAVEYFVSYYDYYQPEAYIPRTDTYIEKDLSINDQIDQMRLSATRSLLARDDVIIVSSVSCIYGLGTPEHYAKMVLSLKVGEHKRRDTLLLHLLEMRYQRSDADFFRGTFRVRGETIDIFPAYEECIAYRLEFDGDEIQRLRIIDPVTGESLETPQELLLYPGSHYVTPEEIREQALVSIEKELQERAAYFASQERWSERERLWQRTRHDMELIREMGFCKGIENYSFHFSGRVPGAPPATLLDYFPENFLLFIDESHQTIPQMRAMYHGDRSRKQALVEFGFRLPSAYDNRPLKFDEAYQQFHQVIYVSATPGAFEIEEAEGEIVEQVIRPTGLLDPKIEVRPATHQVDDVIHEIQLEIAQGGKIFVTTLTKKLAEELSSYLLARGIRAKYLHSEIDTLERVHILRDLRKGIFDVLVGINLLREGLDIPEVTLVAILDADKEGFLRSETSLIQTCGRAARNVKGRVILYGDRITASMERTIEVTQRRREKQQAYNELHQQTPTTSVRPLGDGWEDPVAEEALRVEDQMHVHSLAEIDKKIKENTKKMKQAASRHDYKAAATLRDHILALQHLRTRL